MHDTQIVISMSTEKQINENLPKKTEGKKYCESINFTN